MRYKKRVTREALQEYLKSDKWADVKRRFRKSKLYTGKCYVCGSKKNINLHHKTYKRFGKEYLRDLLEVCQTCHYAAHKFMYNSTSTSVNLFNGVRRYKVKYLAEQRAQKIKDRLEKEKRIAEKKRLGLNKKRLSLKQFLSSLRIESFDGCYHVFDGDVFLKKFPGSSAGRKQLEDWAKFEFRQQRII